MTDARTGPYRGRLVAPPDASVKRSSLLFLPSFDARVQPSFWKNGFQRIATQARWCSLSHDPELVDGELAALFPTIYVAVPKRVALKNTNVPYALWPTGNDGAFGDYTQAAFSVAQLVCNAHKLLGTLHRDGSSGQERWDALRADLDRMEPGTGKNFKFDKDQERHPCVICRVPLASGEKGALVVMKPLSVAAYMFGSSTVGENGYIMSVTNLPTPVLSKYVYGRAGGTVYASEYEERLADIRKDAARLVKRARESYRKLTLEGNSGKFLKADDYEKDIGERDCFPHHWESYKSDDEDEDEKEAASVAADGVKNKKKKNKNKKTDNDEKDGEGEDYEAAPRPPPPSRGKAMGQIPRLLRSLQREARDIVSRLCLLVLATPTPVLVEMAFCQAPLFLSENFIPQVSRHIDENLCVHHRAEKSMRKAWSTCPRKTRGYDVHEIMFIQVFGFLKEEWLPDTQPAGVVSGAALPVLRHGTLAVPYCVRDMYSLSVCAKVFHANVAESGDPVTTNGSQLNSEHFDRILCGKVDVGLLLSYVSSCCQLGHSGKVCEAVVDGKWSPRQTSMHEELGVYPPTPEQVQTDDFKKACKMVFSVINGAEFKGLSVSDKADALFGFIKLYFMFTPAGHDASDPRFARPGNRFDNGVDGDVNRFAFFDARRVSDLSLFPMEMDALREYGWGLREVLAFPSFCLVHVGHQLPSTPAMLNLFKSGFQVRPTADGWHPIPDTAQVTPIDSEKGKTTCEKLASMSGGQKTDIDDKRPQRASNTGDVISGGIARLVCALQHEKDGRMSHEIAVVKDFVRILLRGWMDWSPFFQCGMGGGSVGVTMDDVFVTQLGRWHGLESRACTFAVAFRSILLRGKAESASVQLVLCSKSNTGKTTAFDKVFADLINPAAHRPVMTDKSTASLVYTGDQVVFASVIDEAKASEHLGVPARRTDEECEITRRAFETHPSMIHDSTSNAKSSATTSSVRQLTKEVQKVQDGILASSFVADKPKAVTHLTNVFLTNYMLESAESMQSRCRWAVVLTASDVGSDCDISSKFPVKLEFETTISHPESSLSRLTPAIRQMTSVGGMFKLLFVTSVITAPMLPRFDGFNSFADKYWKRLTRALATGDTSRHTGQSNAPAVSAEESKEYEKIRPGGSSSGCDQLRFYEALKSTGWKLADLPPGETGGFSGCYTSSSDRRIQGQNNADAVVSWSTSAFVSLLNTTTARASPDPREYVLRRLVGSIYPMPSDLLANSWELSPMFRDACALTPVFVEMILEYNRWSQAEPSRRNAGMIVTREGDYFVLSRFFSSDGKTTTGSTSVTGFRYNTLTDYLARMTTLKVIGLPPHLAMQLMARVSHCIANCATNDSKMLLVPFGKSDVNKNTDIRIHRNALALPQWIRGLAFDAVGRTTMPLCVCLPILCVRPDTLALGHEVMVVPPLTAPVSSVEQLDAYGMIVRVLRRVFSMTLREAVYALLCLGTCFTKLGIEKKADEDVEKGAVLPAGVEYRADLVQELPFLGRFCDAARAYYDARVELGEDATAASYPDYVARGALRATTRSNSHKDAMIRAGWAVLAAEHGLARLRTQWACIESNGDMSLDDTVECLAVTCQMAVATATESHDGQNQACLPFTKRVPLRHGAVREGSLVDASVVYMVELANHVFLPEHPAVTKRSTFGSSTASNPRLAAVHSRRDNVDKPVPSPPSCSTNAKDIAAAITWRAPDGHLFRADSRNWPAWLWYYTSIGVSGRAAFISRCTGGETLNELVAKYGEACLGGTGMTTERRCLLAVVHFRVYYCISSTQNGIGYSYDMFSAGAEEAKVNLAIGDAKRINAVLTALQCAIGSLSDTASGRQYHISNVGVPRLAASVVPMDAAEDGTRAVALVSNLVHVRSDNLEAASVSGAVSGDIIFDLYYKDRGGDFKDSASDASSSVNDVWYRKKMADLFDVATAAALLVECAFASERLEGKRLFIRHPEVCVQANADPVAVCGALYVRTVIPVGRVEQVYLTREKLIDAIVCLWDTLHQYFRLMATRSDLEVPVTSAVVYAFAQQLNLKHGKELADTVTADVYLERPSTKNKLRRLAGAMAASVFSGIPVEEYSFAPAPPARIVAPTSADEITRMHDEAKSCKALFRPVVLQRAQSVSDDAAAAMAALEDEDAIEDMGRMLQQLAEDNEDEPLDEEMALRPLSRKKKLSAESDDEDAGRHRKKEKATEEEEGEEERKQRKKERKEKTRALDGEGSDSDRDEDERKKKKKEKKKAKKAAKKAEKERKKKMRAQEEKGGGGSDSDSDEGESSGDGTEDEDEEERKKKKKEKKKAKKAAKKAEKERRKKNND